MFPPLDPRTVEVFRAQPKVELHLHLDCSLSYAFARIAEPQLTPAAYRASFMLPASGPFREYDRYAEREVALLQDEPSLTLAVDDVFRQLAADNVVYAEIRFAPLLHLRAGLSPDRVVEIVDVAVRAAARRTGIGAGVILCTLRHYGAAQSLLTAELVKAFTGTSVVALDLAGDEGAYPIADHVAAYVFARREGLATTAHAGEGAGPQSVWETLEQLAPMRIGHGIRSIEDPALIAHLAAQRIHLEVCPTSNVCTDVCADYPDHPVDRLRRAGVALSINTDGRTISDVSLSEEYARIATAFGWTAADFAACNADALDAAFAPDAVKAQARAALERFTPSRVARGLFDGRDTQADRPPAIGEADH